jgi:bifunctional non-homologous end joining protein LigD
MPFSLWSPGPLRCALCYLEQGRSRLISRNGNGFVRFNRLSDQLATALDVDDVVIGGYVIAADKTGRPQFYDLLRGTRAPIYVTFDLLWLNGVDLRCLPLSERRRDLQSILPQASPTITEALSAEGNGCKLF